MRRNNQKTASGRNRSALSSDPWKYSRTEKVLMVASVASMIDQFNLPNIELLQQMGYEVHVACNFKKGNTCSAERVCKLQKKLQDMQVIWHQWDCPRSILASASCRNAYRQLLELARRYPFAWMHCHSPVGGALARLVAHGEGIPVAYTAHGFHFYQGAPVKNWLLYYPAEKLLAYWTDILITVNKEDYRFAERYLKAGRVFYIPGIGIDMEKFRTGKHMEKFQMGIDMEKFRMGIDMEKFQMGIDMEKFRTEKRTEWDDRRCFRRKYGIPEHAMLLLSAGELSRRKNHRIVIAALSALQRKDVYYLICGQGPLRKELWQYAKRLGVAGYIRMPGYQEDMARVYRNADIFVFPSIQEGMPVALMEAMASGLPCVVSDIRGNRELVAQAGGARFRLGHLQQTEQLKRALVKLMENEKLRYACGAFNRKKIEAFGLPAVQSRMEVIYTALRRENLCL